MGRLAKNFILVALIGSALCIAGLSSAYCNRIGSVGHQDLNFKVMAEIEHSDTSMIKKSDEKNSEFWSKFRDSVMPEENEKGKIPNYEKTPPPSPPREHHSKP